MQRTRVVKNPFRVTQQFSVEWGQACASGLLFHVEWDPGASERFFPSPGLCTALNKDTHAQYAHTPEHHTHAQGKLGSAVSPSAQRRHHLVSIKGGFSTERAWARGSHAGPGVTNMSPVRLRSRTGFLFMQHSRPDLESLPDTLTVWTVACGH